LKLKPVQYERYHTRHHRAMKMLEKIGYSTTTVRLPVGLHAEIKEAAARNGHSMNVEIIARLTSAPPGLTLSDISRQNVRTQEMLQRVIDTLC
jgi:hypothetical protein